MSFRICSKNVMSVAFLSNKIKKIIYSDPKNENTVKILWYFIVFLDFFFNIVKLGEQKFTVSHTKSILIFSLLGSTCFTHVSNTSLIYKSSYAATVLCYCSFSVFPQFIYSGNLVSTLPFFFFLKFRIVATVPCGTVATVFTFFLAFRLYFFSLYIYIYIYIVWLTQQIS